MTNKPISEVIAVLSQVVAETDGSEWQTESGSVITEYYTANGCTVTDHICDCEVVNGDSPVATFIAAANPANVKRLIGHIADLEHTSSVNWEAAASLNVENEENKRKVAALEQQLANQSAHADSAIYKRIAEQYKTDATLSALISRIAELEQQLAAERARVVKLPPDRHCPAEYAGSLLWSETEVWNKAITTCRAALIAAGIPVEGE